MKTSALILMSGLVLGCALGDGRGFATVDGTLEVALAEARFETADGSQVELTTLEITVGYFELEAVHRDERGTEEIISQLPVGVTYLPVESDDPERFGPLEVDRGNYTTFSPVITWIKIEGKLNNASFGLGFQPDEGIRIFSEADLPINRDELPLITMTAKLKIGANILDKVVPAPGADATAKAVAQIVKNIEAGSQFEADWVRKTD